jgi:glycosyltransferase involved in cell wall biosynthesis
MIRVSIITVSYNSAETIRETIDSVLSQHYGNVEYIIVDGNSTDGTQDIVRSYGDRISRFISEPDSGLYHAMNKGIDMATGEIVGILNSDDLYANSEIISDVVKTFETQVVDVVYGDLYYFRTGNPDKPLRYYRGGEFSLRRVRYGLMPPHPTFFIRKTLYEKYGKFDLQFQLSADFDLILRLLGVHKAPFAYLPEAMVKMRIGGKSTSSLKRVLIMNREDLQSCKKNGVRTNIFKFYTKYITKIINFR